MTLPAPIWPTDADLSALLDAAAGAAPLFEPDVASHPGRHRGKVRTMLPLDDATMLIVASDRLSAFDVVFPTPVPAKGRVLTLLSAWWFRELADLVPNHFLALPGRDRLARVARDPDALVGRTMLVRRARPLPIECVVRGRLEGAAWKEYRARGAVMEHRLPSGLALHDRLPRPLFTPATKAATGHDENITFDRAAELVGRGLAAAMRDASLALFTAARDRLAPHGILLADTKFEFGLDEDGGGTLMLIDEALTPDSSRFLVPRALYGDADAVGPDGAAAAHDAAAHDLVAMDKQPIRDWAEHGTWNKTAPAPPLPPDLVARTSARYLDLARRLLATSRFSSPPSHGAAAPHAAALQP